jgi:hypothetical protein
MNTNLPKSSAMIRGLLSGLGLLASANLIHAQTVAPSWDIIGNWGISYFVEDGEGGLSFKVLSENFQTGAFTAWDNNYNQAFSGTVSGSAINFTDYQNATDSFGNPFLNVLSIEGSIAANGTMSGPMDQLNGGTDWHGGFGTVYGEATSIPVPEPSAWAGIVGVVALITTALKRRTPR